jgi:hypothetical protein
VDQLLSDDVVDVTKANILVARGLIEGHRLPFMAQKFFGFIIPEFNHS